MGRVGLGVDGVGRDVGDDLLPLGLQHLLALLGGDLDLALLDDPPGDLRDILCPEGLLDLVLRRPGSFGCVLEDVLDGHVLDDVELLPLLDQVDHLGVQEDLERLPVGFQAGGYRIVEVHHGITSWR